MVKWVNSQKGPGESDAEKMLQKMTTEAMEEMSLLFRNVHALACHGRPFTDYTWLCSLDKAKGLHIGTIYQNNKEATTFCHYIAEAERTVTCKEIESVNFVSLISDGATDSSHTEAEIVYTRYAFKGKVSVKFIGVKNVTKGDSSSITKAILDTMDTYIGQFYHSKVIGMNTDGASVNTGCNNGVVVKIQEELQANIIGLLCNGHKIELCFKDCIKEIRFSLKIDVLLCGVYLFYRNSPLNRSNLKQSCTAAGMKCLLPTRPGGTRWVAHQQRAVSNLLTTYPGMILHLEQVIVYHVLTNCYYCSCSMFHKENTVV